MANLDAFSIIKDDVLDGFINETLSKYENVDNVHKDILEHINLLAKDVTEDMLDDTDFNTLEELISAHEQDEVLWIARGAVKATVNFKMESIFDYRSEVYISKDMSFNQAAYLYEKYSSVQDAEEILEHDESSSFLNDVYNYIHRAKQDQLTFAMEYVLENILDIFTEDNLKDATELVG